MTYLMSAILGLVQGVAEFLPISSSGHLTLLQHFFGMEEPDQLLNILLHFATLLEVKDTLSAGSGIPDGMLGKYLLGMVIAGVVGYFAIRLVNLLANKGKFGAFAYYCWIAGVLFLVLSLLGVTFVPA